MSDGHATHYSYAVRLLLRLEAACDLCWVTYKVRHAPWAWTRENLKASPGRTDWTAVMEIENAATSAARRMPFDALCVPATVTAMRMLRRRGVAGKPQWSAPGVRGELGHVRIGRSADDLPRQLRSRT
jgi:hypothetical protein